MVKDKIIKFTEHIFSGIFYTGIIVFFAFFYNSHLHFTEQFQLFLLTTDFFIEKLGYPGGFSGYIGGFLTQFYYLSFAGPLVITGLLLLLQLAVKRLLFTINSSPVFFPVSFIPSLVAGMIICNEYYPLSVLTGFLLSMISGLVYLSISKIRSRFFAGLILIPLTYWLAGGSYASLLLVILVYELLVYYQRLERKKRKMSRTESLEEKRPVSAVFSGWYLALYLLIAVSIPLFVTQFIILQPVSQSYLSEFYYNIPGSIPPPIVILFIIPALLMIVVAILPSVRKNVFFSLTLQIAALTLIIWFGSKFFVNFRAEETMTYDYLVRNERWNDVLRYADKRPPRNYLSLAMLNLSLAKKDQLGNRMFHYDQHGIDGLFLPFEREYVSAVMGNEIFYHLGLTNASQQYAFESMETIPNLGKSVRVIRRLAETNLINAQYGVTRKYLGLLDKTLFYKKWAEDARTYLGNEEKINNHHDWGEKRRFSVRNDYFFHVMNIEAVLTRMVKEHPENRLAFEYLMAFYLINKDLSNFVNYIPVMEKMAYREVPSAYQQAILYVISLNNQDPYTFSPAYISRDTKLRMSAYAEIYSKYTDPASRLRERFSDTYWFYFHFVEVEYRSVEEKKDNTGST